MPEKNKYTKTEKRNYYKPPAEKDISSGDPLMDFLYKNQWIYKLPTARIIIDKLAKQYAGYGEKINLTLKNPSYKEVKEERDRYTGGIRDFDDKDRNIDLLGQYFSKKPILTKSRYKPSSDYLEFLPTYSIKDRYFQNKSEDEKDKFVKQAVRENFALNDVSYEDFLRDRNPVYNKFNTEGYGNENFGVDLGNFKTGFGWDKEKDLPYYSISDAWDFYPDDYTKIWSPTMFKNVVNNNDKNGFSFNVAKDNDLTEKARQKTKITSSLLHMAGHPYKIYDRIYFDPKTLKYIEDLPPTDIQVKQAKEDEKWLLYQKKQEEKEGYKNYRDRLRNLKKQNIDAASGASVGIYGNSMYTNQYKNGGVMKPNKTPALYNLKLTEDELYSLGGWLKENAGNLFQTVAGGVLTATGLGAEVGIPMMVSGGAGLLGSATADKPDVIDYSNQTRMPRTVGTKNMTPNVMSFKQGGNAKVGKVMKEFKEGKLHSGSKTGQKVKSRKQAIAIALSEAGLDKYANGGDLQRIEGPSHEQGGVQLMPGVEVEGGETVRSNVVNSDNWKISKQIAKIYNLRPSAVGKTPAEYSKLIDNEYKKNENMIGSKGDYNIEMGKISVMSNEMAEIIGNRPGEAQNGVGLPYPGVTKTGVRYPSPQNTFNAMMYNPRINSPYNNVNIPQITVTPVDAKRTSTNVGYQSDPNMGPDINTGIPKPGDMQFLPEQSVVSMKDRVPPDLLRPLERYYADIPAASPIIKKDSAAVRKKGKPAVEPRATALTSLDMSPAITDVTTRVNPVGQKLKTYDELFGYDDSIPEMELPIAESISGIAGTKGTKVGNIGKDILGLAPMAVNAFLAGRTAAEGPDKVKLPRLHHDPYNPELIDPSYQIQQARDSFATGNEAMSQISKKDYLRRRIQSATEEGKVTSGIRGQTAATNAQLLNQAGQINMESKLRTDSTNLEASMQEENINAANKGAWQTSRDFYLSNLGTMAGEYGRDLRLEDANKTYNNKLLDVLRLTGKDLGIGIDEYGNMTRTNTEGVSSEIKLPRNVDIGFSGDLMNDYNSNLVPQQSINTVSGIPRRNPFTGKPSLYNYYRR